MTLLKNYDAFGGYYWQSSTIHNALAYQGYTAPHTGKPYSDALLFGISGGAAFGYFYFHYEGYDPQFNLLTRNTFNLFEPILERLGVVQHVIHTQSADKARKNLLDVLGNGEVPIVWADMFLLPYNTLEYDSHNWAMMPIVVYGYDGETAYIADRADVGLTAPADSLDAARARVKKDKFRIVTLEAPNPEKLSAAVMAGLWDCIKLYTEKPPRGSQNNFGLAGYQAWMKALTKSTDKRSWSKLLKNHAEFYAALTSAYQFSQLFGKDSSKTAERNLFADFLEEAAQILHKPALKAIAPQFRQAGQAWCKVGLALLPDDVPALKQTRELMDKKHRLFLSQGNAALDDIRAINADLEQLKKTIGNEFPVDKSGIDSLKASVADHVQTVHDIEKEAITALREALS
jgi:hypothetical protein